MVSLDQGGKVDKPGSEKAADSAMRGDTKGAAEGTEAADPVADSTPAEPPDDFDDFVMTVTGKSRLVRGRAWKKCGSDEYVRYKCFDDGIEYLPGDSVYIESQQKDQPYFICTIQDFRRSKRDTLMVNIKWFYRVCELPENVYQLLVQDRTTEHDQGLAVHHPAVKHRELFISDATDTFPVAVLRGPCKVIHYSDVHKVREYAPAKDTFFYVLTYNPETRRLASTQGEIRVGPSHQAKLPEYRGGPHAGIPPRPTGVEEERLWMPGRAADCDLMMFLRAARSMAAFAGMCDGGSTDEGCAAAERDATTQNALDVLHQAGYDQARALQALVKSPVPAGVHQRWAEEETKKFVKGLRQYGKNFFRIKKELVPHKETSELVEFYYLWKKTSAAQGNRPRNIARHRRTNGIRRIRNRKTGGKAQREDPAAVGCDLSSTSEADDDSDDSESNTRDMSGYHCRHCFTVSSRGWHHAGKEHVLLCTECRVHFKKYGDLPQLKETRQPPSPLPPVKEEGRMRTRTRAKELSRGRRSRRSSRSRGNTPSDTASNCSSGSSDKVRPTSQAAPPSQPAAKRPGAPLQNAEEGATGGKRRRATDTSGEDSLSDSTSEPDAVEAEPSSSRASSPAPDETEEPAAAPRPASAPAPAKSEPPEPPEPEPAVAPAERSRPAADPAPDEGGEAPPEAAAQVPEPAADPEPKPEPGLEREPSSGPVVGPRSEQHQGLEQQPEPRLERQQVAMEDSERVTCASPAVVLAAAPPSESEPRLIPPSLSEPRPPPIVPMSVDLKPTVAQLQAAAAAAGPAHRWPTPPADSEPQNLTTVKQEPPDERDSSRPVVKRQPTSAPTAALGVLSVTTTLTSEHVISSVPTLPTLQSHPPPPPMPPIPGMPGMASLLPAPGVSGMSLPGAPSPHSLYPHHLYGYPYPYPYQRYPPPPPAGGGPPGEMLDLRKSESREAGARCPSVPAVTEVAEALTKSPSPRPPSASSAAPAVAAGLSLARPAPSPLSVPASEPVAPPPSAGQVIRPAGMALPTVIAHAPPGTAPAAISAARPPAASQPLPPTLTTAAAAAGEPAVEEEDRPATPRPASPQPVIEDSECHRSQSAIFLRHWSRGENNSCARTDLTFKPVPDSKLSRSRQERLRRQTEKLEKEERDRLQQQQQQQRREATSREPGRDKTASRTPQPGHPGEHDRLSGRSLDPATARRSDYSMSSRSVASPGGATLTSGGVPLPPHMDPMYAMAPALHPGVIYPRDRMELEMFERRDREIRELRERDLNERLKEEMLRARPFDPHWLEMQRRQVVPGLFGPPGAMYAPPPPPSPAILSAMEAREREARLGGGGTVPLPPSDPADRLSLQMVNAGLLPPDYHQHQHTHAHTHLHVHPSEAAGTAGAAAGRPPPPSASGGFPPPRPGLLPPRAGEPPFHSLYPPTGLPRSYEEQLVQLSAHAAAQEHMQRRLLERERLGLPLPHSVPTSLHPSLLAQHQQEYLRMQRERDKR